MSFSFSQPQTSSFLAPNELLDLENLRTAPQRAQNQLLMQQQEIGGHEVEMGARLAGTLLSSYDTPEARAAAYPTLLARARSLAPGYFKNAPDTYPGDAATQALARMGTPSADLIKLQGTAGAVDAYGNSIGLTGTRPGGGGGGGTGGDGLTGDKAHDLPLIAQRESGGNPTVLNYVAQQDPTAYARGATASGKYQIVNSTWREGLQLAGLDLAQYATARDAPVDVQDKVASALYDKYGNAPWKKGPRDWVKDEQGRYQMATVRSPAAAPSAAPPGASTAPAAPPGVQMGGAPPPPPGSAPGAYPASGGGMGAVISQPASGRRMTQAERLGGTEVAGPPMVASTQPTAATPTTDPLATPARYAGTAPAPPAEAPPETGWGSQVGSGYGPQNAVAPPVPAQPAVPAAQQPPAPAQQPPAPTPAAQAMPPELQTDNSYLTPRDKQQLAPLFDQARRGLIPLTTLQNEVQQRQTFNVQRQKDFLAAQQQTMENARQVEADRRATETQRLAQITSQREQEAAAALAEQRRIDNARAAETQRLAQETAAREAAKAVDLTLQGGDDGSARYAAAYATKAAPIRNPDGSTVYPNMTAYDKPTYRGGKGQVADASGAPDYGEPRVTPPTILSVDQAKAATYADRMLESHNVMNKLDAAATSWAESRQAKAGDFIGYTTASPDYQRLRAAQDNFITAKLRPESGAVINPSEFENDRRTFFPQPGDDLATIALKRKFRETTIAGVAREAGPAYKPPTGAASDASTPTRVIRYDHTGTRIKE